VIKNNIKKLRERYDLTQQELAEIAGVTNKAVWAWENGISEPRMGAIEKIASHFKIKKSNIIEDGGMDNIEENNRPFATELTSKDELDIQKELQKMIDGLNSKDGLAAFDGQSIDELDEEDRELLIASLEQSLRIAKRMAKQKFAPKKYRK
jgi:transcriptional regulator with XRE-family HTH domain